MIPGLWQCADPSWWEHGLSFPLSAYGLLASAAGAGWPIILGVALAHRRELKAELDQYPWPEPDLPDATNWQRYRVVLVYFALALPIATWRNAPFEVTEIRWIPADQWRFSIARAPSAAAAEAREPALARFPHCGAAWPPTLH